MHPCLSVRALLCVLSVVAVLVRVSSTSVLGRHRNVFVESMNPPAESGPRIIGGYDAQPGEFPYQVSVRMTQRKAYGHFCGGAILNATTIVTAAHCVARFGGSAIGSLYIVAGSNLLSSGGVKVFVKEQLVHPDYGPVYQDYDIALLYLEHPLPLDGVTMAAVGLQDVQDLPSGHPCVASGWGRTVASSSTTPLPDKLQGVSVPIVDFNRCARYYMEETSEYAPIIEAQLCAGYEEGKKDACQGDSGGPLVCKGLLTGIVSWGMGCAVPRFPGVYTDVAFLAPWIEENVVMDPNPQPPTSSGSTASPSNTTESTSGASAVALATACLTLVVTKLLAPLV